MYFSAGSVWCEGSWRRTAWCCHSYQARFRTATREMVASRIVGWRVERVRIARRKVFLCSFGLVGMYAMVMVMVFGISV